MTSSAFEDNADAVAIGDVEGLTGRIEALCFDERWDLVVDLRDRCRLAVERGKQLWPAAAYAEYRMALDGPPNVSASVASSNADRYTLGPFSEVMASTHTFVDLQPHLDGSPAAAIVAHERVVAGEDLGSAPVAFADVLAIPLRLQPWEPVYPLARYFPNRGEFDTPEIPFTFHPPKSLTPGRPYDDAETIRSLTSLVGVWLRESNGRAEAVAVEGDGAAAVLALGCSSARLAEIPSDQALAWMAWAAGNGGAHGRRPGMAAGRQGAWWALTHLAGLANEPDVRPDELGDAAAEMRWYLWDDGSPSTGWSLRLAVEDPAERLAWALNAIDQRL